MHLVYDMIAKPLVAHGSVVLLFSFLWTLSGTAANRVCLLGYGCEEQAFSKYVIVKQVRTVSDVHMSIIRSTNCFCENKAN